VSQPFARSGRRFRCLLVLLAFLLPAMAFAQVSDPAPLRFQDSHEEQRFHALVTELRCVMCQNQSLADSNAQIAHDLRREVLTLMRQGKSDAQIRDYLVARYGEFVLYKPRVEEKTWLLWFGPALLLLVGGFVVARVVRRHAGDSTVPVDDAQEW
jgi:cytochrome c-type biogenesis protein CcmH